MTHKSIQIQNGLLRDLRLERGLTQLQVAKEARLSENSVASAENGRPVSKRTVREIIKVLDATAELLCIDAENGLYTIEKKCSPPTGHDILKFMSNELGGASTAEEFKSKLEMILKLAGVKQAFISELFERSLHWSMGVPAEAADKLRSLFEANEDGELIIDSGSLKSAMAQMARIEVEGKILEADSPKNVLGSGSLWFAVMPKVTLALGLSVVLFLTYCFSQLAKPQLVTKPQPLAKPRPFTLLLQDFPLLPTVTEERVDLWFIQSQFQLASKLRTLEEELRASLKAFIDAPQDRSLETALLRGKLLEARAMLSESQNAYQNLVDQVPETHEWPDADVRGYVDVKIHTRVSNPKDNKDRSNSKDIAAGNSSEAILTRLRAEIALKETIAQAEAYVKENR